MAVAVAVAREVMAGCGTEMTCRLESCGTGITVRAKSIAAIEFS